MKLAKILTTLTSEPLLCTNEYRAALLELFQQHSQLSKADFRAERTGKAQSGSELDVEQMVVRDGIAIIPVGGPIGIDLGEFEKGAGAVDVDDIAEELDQSELDDEVNSIILNFDSPGGMVNGTPELGDKIAAVEKPIYAFSRGKICSAAYWLAASTDGIFATRSADIGCIGICATFLDLTKMAEMQGIKVKVFGSGVYKGMGAPGTALTAEQEMFIKNRIMTTAEMFYQHVRDQRGAIADADMQGQYFCGQEALDKGFIDGVMKDLGELEAFLR